MNKNEIINVLNYNENPVCIKSRLREYMCPKGSRKLPSVTPLEYSEIEEINSISPCFRTGLLFFEENKAEEIYKSLRILNFQDILKNEDIENIILNPTYEGLKKLVEIDSISYFERVRGIFYYLKNSDMYDISIRVSKIIDERYKELNNRKTKTNIVLNRKSLNIKNENKILEENKALKTEIAKLKEAINKASESPEPKTKGKKRENAE